MAQHRSDPAFVERLARANRTLGPAARASIAAHLRQNVHDDPIQQAKRTERARRMVAQFSADRQLTMARSERANQSRAANLARRLRIPLAFVADYRVLRRRKFTKEQAIGILARSHPAEFKAYQQAQVAQMRRVIDWRIAGAAP